MKLTKLARLGATGIAMGAASYVPVAVLTAESQPAGATISFFSCIPHGHVEGWYGPSCISELVSDVTLKENIVPVVW